MAVRALSIWFSAHISSIASGEGLPHTTGWRPTHAATIAANEPPAGKLS